MIKLSNEAMEKIKSSISNNTGKFPKIILKNGGCSGNMLVLILSGLEESDDIIEVKGINFAISKNAKEYIDDIEIYIKNKLGSEIVIKNNKNKTCKCGKSFEI